MTLDHYVSIFSAAISFVGLLLVVLQLRDSARQRASQSLVEIYDMNRQLISLGFSHPELFAILADAKDPDPVLERRYLQLWLNQFSLVNSYLNQSVFKGELKESLVSDLTDFMTLNNMQHHWRKYGRFYPASFQALVDGIIKKKWTTASYAAAQVSYRWFTPSRLAWRWFQTSRGTCARSFPHQERSAPPPRQARGCSLG
jgi:hypothetical protein